MRGGIADLNWSVSTSYRFLAYAREQYDGGVPRCVERELRAYLKSGVFAPPSCDAIVATSACDARAGGRPAVVTVPPVCLVPVDSADSTDSLDGSDRKNTEEFGVTDGS